MKDSQSKFLSRAIVFSALTICIIGFALDSFAQNWILMTNAPSTNWSSVASSADGRKLVAVVGEPVYTAIYNVTGGIYTSTNYGLTWTFQTNAPVLNWVSVASSSDGAKLTAAAGTQNQSVAVKTGIFTSSDSGVTWTSNALPRETWTAVCSSSGGTQLAAFDGSQVWTSTNSGQTWQTNSSNPIGVSTCAASADGHMLIAGGISGPVSFSTNFGETWNTFNPNPSAGGWNSVACSADGEVIAGSAIWGGGVALFISTNAGASWATNVINNRGVQNLALSSDGSKMVDTDVLGQIYISTNSGVTWTTNSALSVHWSSVASSADFNHLVAVVEGGGIYTGESLPSLNIESTNGSVKISWPSYAGGFTLQQCGDLSSENWVNVALPANDDGTNKSVMFASPTGTAFFRLVQ